MRVQGFLVWDGGIYAVGALMREPGIGFGMDVETAWFLHQSAKSNASTNS